MMSFGKLFNVSIYGESHGEKIGIVIDGMKPGIKVDYDLLNNDLLRRKSGKAGTTKRIEADTPCINSGVFNDFTTGFPINISFENSDTRSKDYSSFLTHPRPSHADYAANIKYDGFQDYRGGGHFSGRITLGLVAAGAFAKMMIPCRVSSKLIQIGNVTNEEQFDDYVKEVEASGDSVGGIIEIRVNDVPAGLGSPFFESVESKIASILYSVPAVKGVEFGEGFNGVTMLGSEFNDMIIDELGHTSTNHNGGINGGISNGNEIVVRVFVKPTPSIMKPMMTYDFLSHEISELNIKGRHDVCIASRAVVVCENAVMIALADLFLMGK